MSHNCYVVASSSILFIWNEHQLERSALADTSNPRVESGVYDRSEASSTELLIVPVRR